MRSACIVMVAVLLGIVGVETLRAQREKPYEFSELDSVWVHIKRSDNSFADLKFSAVEQSTALQKREAIFEILKNSKVLNPLKGVALRAEMQVVARSDSQGNYKSRGPVEMTVGMTIGKFLRSVRTGGIEPFTTEMPRIEIRTNNQETTACTWSANKFWYEGLHDEQGREFYLEPHVTAKSDGGFNIYRLDAWHEEVVVSNGRPLWIPATGEQFLRAMITYARELREKENESSRLSRAPMIPEDKSVPVQFIRSYERELAALSPVDQQQPAYYLRSNDNPMLSGLVKAGTPEARLVMIDNPDYFNKALPHTAVQLISCLYNYNAPYGSDEPEKPDLCLKTLNNLARRLEYEKLAALIEK